MRQHWVQMRENGGSLDFNFISLLNPTVDENWICRLHLLQFFLQKWYHSNHARCSDLFKLFMWTANLLNVSICYHILCARIDLIFTIFICSRYRPWATIRLLHHFGFVMCVNSRLYCTHFSCHWRKIHVLRRLTQISKRHRNHCGTNLEFLSSRTLFLPSCVSDAVMVFWAQVILDWSKNAILHTFVEICQMRQSFFFLIHLWNEAAIHCQDYPF